MSLAVSFLFTSVDGGSKKLSGSRLVGAPPKVASSSSGVRLSLPVTTMSFAAAVPPAPPPAVAAARPPTPPKAASSSSGVRLSSPPPVTTIGFFAASMSSAVGSCAVGCCCGRDCAALNAPESIALTGMENAAPKGEPEPDTGGALFPLTTIVSSAGVGSTAGVGSDGSGSGSPPLGKKSVAIGSNTPDSAPL